MQVFMKRDRYESSIEMKIRMTRYLQVFRKVSNTKLHYRPFIGSQIVTGVHRDRQTYEQNYINGCLARV